MIIHKYDRPLQEVVPHYGNPYTSQNDMLWWSWTLTTDKHSSRRKGLCFDKQEIKPQGLKNASRLSRYYFDPQGSSAAFFPNSWTCLSIVMSEVQFPLAAFTSVLTQLRLFAKIYTIREQLLNFGNYTHIPSSCGERVRQTRLLESKPPKSSSDKNEQELSNWVCLLHALL